MTNKHSYLKLFPAIILSLVCITSCGIYGRYSRPEIQTDSLYRHSPSDTSSLGNISWRVLFSDTLLQNLIDCGLENNTDLKIARLKIDEAEAVLMNARLSYIPSVGLAPEGGIGYMSGSSAEKTFNLSASASWEIDIFGRVTNAKRGARAALENSKAYAQAVQTQLIATIANSYYMLLLLDEQTRIQRESLVNWEEMVSTLQAMKRAGKYNETAVLQAEAELLGLRQSLASLEEETEKTENALSALIGIAPGNIGRGLLSEAVFPDTLCTGIPLQLVSNRPDVRDAEFAVAEAFYATNAARSAFYPNIVLGGSAGWTNNVSGAILNPAQWLFSAVGSLMQPLFNKGTNIANLKVAKARQEEAALLFSQSLLDAGVEVNDAVKHWQTANTNIEFGKEQVSILTETLRKTRILMENSSTDYLEVLTAQQSLLDAEMALAQNQFYKIQGVIDLYHSLGGGRE